MTPFDPLLEEVSSRFGLTPRSNWDQEVDQAARILAARFDCEPLDLVARAEEDPRIIDVLVGHLTVGESYFFRHGQHFEALERHLEAWSLEPGDRPFRVLSLGCATGEEAYSVAITARKTLGARQAGRVEILGCDLSNASVEKADHAAYADWSFRGVDPALRESHFEAEGETWRLNEDVRSLATFSVSSIRDFTARLPSGSVDAVFFRNVAIYLTAETTRAIYAEIARVQRDAGLLFVAPADPRPAEALARVDGEGHGVYRKDESVETYPDHALGLPMERVGDRPAPDFEAEAARPVQIRETAPVIVRPEPAPPGEELLSKLQLHGDRGETREALRIADELIEASPSCPSGHLLRARLRIAAGEEAESLPDLRKVAFLDPGHCVGRYWYVVALAHSGQEAKADRQLGVLEEQLRELPENEPLEDGEVTAGELLRAVEELAGSRR